MKYFIAFIISVVIHGVIYYYYINDSDKVKNKNLYKSIKSNKIKSTKVQYIQLKPKIVVKNKKPKSISKKHKKVNLKEKPKLKPKVKINKKVIKKQIKNKTIEKIDEEIKPNIKPRKIIKKPKMDNQTKELIDLYGDSFDKFDKQTKLFLVKHIKDIGAITKRFLTYPSLSIQARQSGVNVIEFVLYPNGSIKNVMVSKSSGYFMLDDNTMDTIYDAYEDYPRPIKPTLIKIFVKYELIMN